MFDRVSGIATAAEDSGFDSLFVMDHFQQIRGVGSSPEEPMLEARAGGFMLHAWRSWGRRS